MPSTRLLAIREKALGPVHLDVGTSLNNLALLYYAQGKYDRAEPLYQRSLAIREKALGPDHLDVGTSLNNLALLYYAQGKYDRAEPLYQRSLAIFEKALDPKHPITSELLINLHWTRWVPRAWRGHEFARVYQESAQERVWLSIIPLPISGSGTSRRWSVVGFRRVAAVGRGTSVGEGTQLCLGAF